MLRDLKMAIKDPTSGMMRVLTFEEMLDQIRSDKKLSERPSPLVAARLNTFWFQSPYNQRMYNEVGEDLNRINIVQAQTARAQQSFEEAASEAGIPASVMRAAAADAPPRSPRERSPKSPRERSRSPRGARSQSQPGASSTDLPQDQRSADIRNQAQLLQTAMEARASEALDDTRRKARVNMSGRRAALDRVTSIRLVIPRDMREQLKEREQARRAKAKERAKPKASSSSQNIAPQPIADTLAQAARDDVAIMQRSRATHGDRTNQFDDKRRQEEIAPGTATQQRPMTRLRRVAG